MGLWNDIALRQGGNPAPAMAVYPAPQDPTTATGMRREWIICLNPSTPLYIYGENGDNGARAIEARARAIPPSRMWRMGSRKSWASE